jgi:hypothetical protein
MSRILLSLLMFAYAAQWAECNTGQFSIQFKDHLNISNDVRLTGIRSATSFRFTCESDWKPIPGGALHLYVAHSSELDSDRSFLSVTLNYGVLRSFRLDEHNAAETELVIPLPAGMIQPDNELVVSVEQFPKEHASNRPWTTVKVSSFVSLQYEESRSTLDLRLLPSPLVDQRSYRPKEISVLVPERASSQTLEATALLVANYAATLNEPLNVHTVTSIDAATDRLLIVGTPDEQPLHLVINQLPFGLFRLGSKIVLGENPQKLFETSAGVVALAERPGQRFRPFLLVTGDTPDGVLKAARKLIDGHLEGPSTFAKIQQDARSTAAASREWRGFIPPQSHFIFGDLHPEELSFDFQNGYSASIPLLATPDAQFLEYGHQITLRFRVSPNANINDAHVDVQLNGFKLGDFRAADFSTANRTSIRLKLPPSLLRTQNLLNITWRNLESASDASAAAWLLPATEFELPRDFDSTVPDLGLLQYGLFPFAIKADLSDTVIVVPDASENTVTAALFKLAARLGQLVHSSRFAFQVRRQSEFQRDQHSALNVIALRIGSLPLAARAKNLMSAAEEKVSGEHYALTITAGSSGALQSAMETIFLDATLKQLRGDTSLIYSDHVASFKTQPVQRIHEYSYFAHLQTWMRANWVALPVILTTISCLLFVGLRLALAQYKNRAAGAQPTLTPESGITLE